jgi:hypothetical protein
LVRITSAYIGVADELDVSRAGLAVYQVRSGEGHSGVTHAHRQLSAAALTRLRSLVASASFREPRRAPSAPTAGGYYYVLRVGGRSVSLVSGGVPRSDRALITTLDRLADGLEAGST